MLNLPADRNQRSYWILAGVVTLLAAGLMVYAQTDAFTWDEGFHLLTAQLITRGKRPYLDFNFSQTPLNAWWNAFWITVFPQSWRTTHAVASVMTTAATLMTADFLFVRFPVRRWRFVAALMASFVLGLNVLIVQFGPVGQAYGLGLFLIVAAFRLIVASVDRKGLFAPALAGLLASAGAGATLLVAPVCPVLALWMAFQNRIGNRWNKLAAFLSAAAIPFLPVLYLFLKGPRQTFFNIVQYNLVFRQVEWPGAIGHDVLVMLSWVHSAQAVIVGSLALAGFLFVRFRSGQADPKWNHSQRAEFYLCGWLALALVLYVSTAHPTFPRYYLFALPFLSILAAAGLYSIARHFEAQDRPFWPVLALTAIFSLELAHALYDKHYDVNWPRLEQVATTADQVTPPGEPILSDEQTYFLTRRAPPSGMELADSHKLDFPPESSISLHLISESEILKQLEAGTYATAVDCHKGHKLTEEKYRSAYRQHARLADCNVYWDRVR